MNASRDQLDRVDRARLVESCGTRDDSPSWNLGRAKQGGTIRVDGTSPRGRGQKDVKESEQEVLPITTKSRAGCKNKESDASVTRLPGNDESSETNPISKELLLIGRRFGDEKERREWRRQVLRMTLPRRTRRCARATGQTSEVAARTCRFS